mmetsp:Transcript_21893/g.61215  ORF Transcript_21893/g.61215 Transcript_21893/m.61215 type:complete len:326 (+) Transcript_21893:886-1863(+)
MLADLQPVEAVDAQLDLEYVAVIREAAIQHHIHRVLAIVGLRYQLAAQSAHSETLSNQGRVHLAHLRCSVVGHGHCKAKVVRILPVTMDIVRAFCVRSRLAHHPPDILDAEGHNIGNLGALYVQMGIIRSSQYRGIGSTEDRMSRVKVNLQRRAWLRQPLLVLRLLDFEEAPHLWQINRGGFLDLSGTPLELQPEGDVGFQERGPQPLHASDLCEAVHRDPRCIKFMQAGLGNAGTPVFMLAQQSPLSLVLFFRTILAAEAPAEAKRLIVHVPISAPVPPARHATLLQGLVDRNALLLVEMLATSEREALCVNLQPLRCCPTTPL